MSAALLSAQAAKDVLKERPLRPKPAVVRYPWRTWTAEPFQIHFAEQGVDFWCSSPRAFGDALGVHAARHGLAVKRTRWDYEADDGSVRECFLFRFRSLERTA